MAFQQNFGSPTMHFGSDGDVSLKQQSNSASQPSTLSENSSGCFDCNICLDSSRDPVVTLCGHLYCWPCIYKWLQVQNSSFDSDERPKCPVCKSYISASSLVPLYGRGISTSESEAKGTQLDLAIPHRPKALNINALVSGTTPITSEPNHQNTFEQQQYISHPFNNYSTPTSFFSPTINMVGEMVFATMFGSSDPSMFAYPYTNSYPFLGNDSMRLRRQEMQLDKSLNRLSIFLFCCIVLCLILF